MTTDTALFAATAVFGTALWFWLIGHFRRIERRLDREYDYFRYIERGPTWVGPRTLDWLLPFLRQYRTLDYSDPVLDRLVAECKRAWAIWVGSIVVWLVGAALWVAIA